MGTGVESLILTEMASGRMPGFATTILAMAAVLVLVALYSTHDGESIKAGKEWFNDEDELAAKNADPEGKIKTIPSWVETEADLEEYFSQTGAKVDRRQSGKVMKTEEAEVLLQDWTDTSDIPDENGVKAHGDIMHDGSEDKEPLFDMSGFKQPKFNLEQVNTFDKADILSGEYRLEDQQEAHKVKALAAQQADIEDADEIDEAMLVQRILGEKDAMSAEDRAEHLQRPWSDADLLHGLASSPETLMLQEEGPSIVGAEKHLQRSCQGQNCPLSGFARRCFRHVWQRFHCKHEVAGHFRPACSRRCRRCCGPSQGP